MSVRTQEKTKKRMPDAAIPALQNGDHLTRAEFERRYHAQPHLKKAELIEGVVYVPSPVSIDSSTKREATWLLDAKPTR